MQDNSHHDDSDNQQQNQINRSPEYGQPTFTAPSTHALPQNITSNKPSSFGPQQGQAFAAYQQTQQTFTTLPPINISSGLPPLTIQGSQPINLSSQQGSIPPPFGVPGGIILGPPISILGGIHGGVTGGIPFGYRQDYQGPPSFAPNHDMVPRSEFQKCAQQCHIWQIKYKQLNNKYLSLLRQKGSGQPIDQAKLRQQNYILQQKVLSYQAAQRQLSSNIDVYITNLVNKYKQSTLRQTAALFDQFKRQYKTQQKHF